MHRWLTRNEIKITAKSSQKTMKFPFKVNDIISHKSLPTRRYRVAKIHSDGTCSLKGLDGDDDMRPSIDIITKYWRRCGFEESHEDEFYVIEVAPGLFLADYEQMCSYCANEELFFRNCDFFPNDKRFKYDKDYRYAVVRFTSRTDALSYIRKHGSKSDFMAWCSEMAESHGGDGIPRIRKVKVKLTASINTENDDLLFDGAKKR